MAVTMSLTYVPGEQRAVEHGRCRAYHRCARRATPQSPCTGAGRLLLRTTPPLPRAYAIRTFSPTHTPRWSTACHRGGCHYDLLSITQTFSSPSHTAFLSHRTSRRSLLTSEDQRATTITPPVFADMPAHHRPGGVTEEKELFTTTFSNISPPNYSTLLTATRFRHA